MESFSIKFKHTILKRALVIKPKIKKKEWKQNMNINWLIKYRIKSEGRKIV